MISRAAIEEAKQAAIEAALNIDPTNVHPLDEAGEKHFEAVLQAALTAALAAEGMALVPVGDVEKLRSALRGLSDMYSSTWDRVDGGLMMMESGVERFEKAHQVAYELLYPDRVLHDDDEAAMLKAAGASNAGK